MGETGHKKRKHHFVPKLYLKGFVENKGEPFIWVYERGKPYNPGVKRGINNPHRDSITFAGSKKDAYAYTKRDGESDFEKYENILEKLEKPADSIFAKVRDQQMITSEDKETFSSYIILMDRRVPRRELKAKGFWPEVVEKSEKESELVQELNALESITDPNDAETMQKIKIRREHLSQLFDEFRKGMPKEILLESMVTPSALAPFLSKMNWRFLVAPEGSTFITGDNPVFYFESMGLNKPDSEVSFPISSEIALSASWHSELKEGFVKVPVEVVSELNRRTALISTRNVYHRSRAEWLVKFLNKSEYRLNFLH